MLQIKMVWLTSKRTDGHSDYFLPWDGSKVAVTIVHKAINYSYVNAAILVSACTLMLYHFKHWVVNSMMTSSNGNIFRITGLLCGKFSGEFPAQRPVTRSFDVNLICAWSDSWAHNGDAGDLTRYRAHYDVIVMGQTEHRHYNSPVNQS